MPDGRHHDPHIEVKLIRAGLCKKVALKEHAGPFAELNNRTGHAFGPEGGVRRSVEGDGIEVCNIADLVRAFGAEAVHPTFLAQGLDRPPALDGPIQRELFFADQIAAPSFKA